MSGPHAHLDAREQWIFDQLRQRLVKDCPVSDGPYSLSLRPLPVQEQADWYGQAGPVLFDSLYVSASVHFDGLTHGGEPWGIDGIVRLYARKEQEKRADAMVQAFLRFCKRLMRDVQDLSFGLPGWLGLIHISGAMMDLLRAPPKRTQTVEQCLGVLLASKQVRDVVMPDEGALLDAMNALDAWCASRQVMYRDDRLMLEVVEKPSWNWVSEGCRATPHGVEMMRRGLFVTFRVAVMDEEGQVEDVKEQQVHLLSFGEVFEAARMCASLEALVRVMPRLVEKWGRDRIARMMPVEFLDVTAVRLKKPVTVDDFVKVYERRQKLG